MLTPIRARLGRARDRLLSVPSVRAAASYLLEWRPDTGPYDRTRRLPPPMPRENSELERLYFAHDGRFIYKWQHYLAVYEQHLAPFRDGFPLGGGGRRPLRLLEIGVFHGGSLQLWRKYLGPSAIIFGIDIDPACAGYDDGATRVRIGSQADPAFLAGVVAEMGGLDVVIDDGSHVAAHQSTSFRTLFPLLADGGVYICEDVHTSYWRPEFNGGYRRRGTFIEVAKQLVDDMHGWHHQRRPSLADARTSIESVSFHDSIVVIRKRLNPDPPRDIGVGRASRVP